MNKTLEFTTKSPQQIKQGDTETMFTFICKSAGEAVDLTQATSITAKIGNASGYLRSQPITITSLAGLNPGWLNLQPTPALISGLPDGDYQLEIWVIDQAGTSIYPSDKPLGFTITNNIESESGASITTIAFDDFVEAMNKAASTIAKGDPGEGLDIKGQVTSVSALPTTANEGDGYLVNEELYVYTSGAWKDCGPIQGPQGIQGKTGTGISSTTIQYQISSSATTTPTGTWSNNIVATTTANPYLWMKATLNYTDNTTKDFYLVSQKGDKGDKGDTGTVDNAGLTAAPAFVELKTQVDNSAVGTNLLVETSRDLQTAIDSPNKNYSGAIHSFSSDELSILAGNHVTARTFIHNTTTHTVNLVIWTNIDGFGIGTGVPAGTDGYSTITAYNIASSNKLGEISIRAYTENAAISGVQYKKLKLEKGSVATDWCPNPTDVLTQSDYAKIKAAILSLGGHLS
ncbi:Prophage protein [Lactiplantibacillus plantarum]|uniref:collagen-like protein n=1 Tax=Lactiplantibacillus plantarum TaxID=1590 RepID=UPI0013035D7E|nr:collagen-like protein [Lactiplantibacillus plantarum]MCG0596153.1 Prophage protein [Lactiplantibacillus plantarum]MCG0624836.1 Prophage protein [Lactiplantibacillus plantarum]MCG0751831.1 Prophage protein [Lactiplantibacillus plantarum]MCG0761028.1 Prophage protein [Lactiplantibacillus plantarum]MCG0888139.1 Prophage protein [Lactiplantibacillus plantarum]